MNGQNRFTVKGYNVHQVRYKGVKFKFAFAIIVTILHLAKICHYKSPPLSSIL